MAVMHRAAVVFLLLLAGSASGQKEPPDLWTDPEAREVFALHWAAFARRYKGIPSERLSFDLLNEPAGVTPAAYAVVVQAAVDAIRKEDPDRIIIAEGLQWGNAPV